MPSSSTADNTRLSVEELLKPRYLIKNEWFDCPYPNGTILVPLPHGNGFGPEDWEPGYYIFLEEDLKKYPYLTRKLEWWEHREEGQMPEYVKEVRGWNVFKVVPDEKCEKPFKDNAIPLSFIYPINYHYEPATESEYLSFINAQTPTP